MTSQEESRGMNIEGQREITPVANAAVRGDAPGALSLSASPCGTVRRVTAGKYTLSLTYPSELESGLLYEKAKRTGDALSAAALLILLFPIFAVVALAVFLEDRGPILYYQTRVGRNGTGFRFYKFRSMVQDADAVKERLAERNEAGDIIFKMEHDPRVTRIGRFLRRYSIDELPQLMNVLRGEMSLVGPRPHLPKEVALYSERQQARVSVQPGLLCFREVFGRSKMTFEEWVELDLLYIEHRSFRTDFLILMRTLPAVLTAEGAY